MGEVILRWVRALSGGWGHSQVGGVILGWVVSLSGEWDHSRVGGSLSGGWGHSQVGTERWLAVAVITAARLLC